MCATSGSVGMSSMRLRNRRASVNTRKPSSAMRLRFSGGVPSRAEYCSKLSSSSLMLELRLFSAVGKRVQLRTHVTGATNQLQKIVTRPRQD